MRLGATIALLIAPLSGSTVDLCVRKGAPMNHRPRLPAALAFCCVFPWGCSGQVVGPQTSPGPVNNTAPRKEQAVKPGPSIPTWAVDARWYYLELGRFSNGEPANDPPGVSPWTPEGSPKSDDAVRTWAGVTASSGLRTPDVSVYGGDLQGLIARLAYLEDLGVNAVILDSIFQGSATFPWVVRDLRHVDDAFGTKGSLRQIHGESEDPASWQFSATDRLFIEFLDKVHARGLRVVLSGLFGDLGRGQLALEVSDSHALAVTRRWMDPNGDGDPSDGVDGWLVSMPTSLPDAWWPGWAAQVKKINPNAILILRDAMGGAKPAVSAAFDVAVNVRTSLAIRDFFRPHDDQQSLQRLFDELGTYFGPTAGRRRLTNLNLFSDLRSPRLVTFLQLSVPTVAASAFSSTPKPSEPILDRWRLATIVQHFCPGAPVTYYGDEVGMYGLCKPWARPPMWWPDSADPASKPQNYRGDLLALVHWLHQQREQYAPLRRGEFRTVLLDEGHRIFAFARSLPGDEVILVVNYGKTKQKVVLPAGKPGQLVGVLSPQIKPPPLRAVEGKNVRRSGPVRLPATGQGVTVRTDAKTRTGPTNEAPNYSRIRRLRMGGSRQFVNAQGRIVLWVNPMSIRVVLVNDKEPRR